MNLKVRSAHDQGVYCVDIGIVRAGVIPVSKPAAKWECLSNADLVSFGEAKKLVVYPMLLAQFVGIVHEIKPLYLAAPPPPPGPHPYPTLIALGNFSANAHVIVSNYPLRSISVNIAQNYDVRLARVRRQPGKSPLCGNEF